MAELKTDQYAVEVFYIWGGLFVLFFGYQTGCSETWRMQWL